MSKFENGRQTPDPAATLESMTGVPSTSRPLDLSKTAVENQSMNFANSPGHAPGQYAYPSGSNALEGYTIKRGIGVGGFGEVYFALSDAGKEVALKRIQRNLDVELRGVRQCLNLKHINLISLWDIRTNQAGESWVVMEYVPGPSLRDLVEAHPNGMPEDQVRLWFSSTAAGTAYLHNQGIVHRDLKPANIFYDEDQQVIKIGDYGLSKFISCSRRSGQTETVGTFHYMAPEIGKGIYGKEIDIYALGIILYELLTGDVPFDGESTQEIIMKHLTADPNLDRVPIKFRDALGRCMLKDPEQRFRNVDEMLAALPWPSGEKVVVANPKNVRAENTAPQKQTNDKSVLVNEIEITLVEQGGIAFGPLLESTAGTRPADPIQFIETSQTADPIANTVAGHPDEPIAKAVHGGFSSVSSWWNNAGISTPLKIFLLFVAGAMAISNSEWLLPAAAGLGILYAIYYGIRIWLMTPKSESSESDKTEVVANRLTKRELTKLRQTHVREFLGSRATSDLVTELTGSLLVSALACVIFSLLGMAIGGTVFEATVGNWAIFAWSTLSCVAACWALLITSKCWEHREADGWLRRLAMAAIGLVVGLVSYASGTMLNVDFIALSSAENLGPNPFTNTPLLGEPNLFAFLIFFTALFGALRWWRQVDPVRKTRLSLVSVGTCLVWAALFSHALAFAPIWMCILAVVVSVSSQLGAAWLHPLRQEKISLNSLSDTVRV